MAGPGEGGSHRKTMMAEPSKDGTGRARAHEAAEKPPCGGFRFGARYASGFALAASFAAKCSRAASAASGAMPQVVFFASGARANSRRRYERSAFGSIPISSARALGVMVLTDMVPPLALRPSRAGLRWVGVSFMYVVYHNAHAVCERFTNPLQLERVFVPCSGNAGSVVHPDTTPPATPPKDRSQIWQPQVRSEAPRPYFSATYWSHV